MIKDLLFGLGLYLVIRFERRGDEIFSKWAGKTAYTRVFRNVLAIHKYSRQEAMKARAMAAWYTNHARELGLLNKQALDKWIGA